MAGSQSSMNDKCKTR